MDKSNFAVSTYNRIADLYANQYFEDLTDVPYIFKFLSLLPEKASILDVGCGPGQFTKYMLEKGYAVDSIDLSSKMIEVAQKRVPGGKFTLMDMRNLTFKTHSFDGLLTPTH